VVAGVGVRYDFSPDNLDTFVEQVLGGQLKPYLKSEPIPTSNEGPVEVRVRLVILEYNVANDD